MMLLLLFLLQAQRRISPFVIIGASLVFIAGVSLLVYFYRRYKRMEKETEEDWEAGRHSLFVKSPSIDDAIDSPLKAVSTAKVEKRPEPTERPEPAELPAATGGTRDLAADIALSSFSPVTAAEAEPQLAAPPVEEHVQPPPAQKPESRPTEVLASAPRIEPVIQSQPKPEPSSVVERVRSGVDSREHLTQSGDHRPTILSQVEVSPPPGVARVESQSHREPFEPPRIESRSHREPFESPRIERILQREPYEAPTVEPLTPREAAATRELRSPQIPSKIPAIDRPPSDRKKESVPQGTIRLASPPPATRGASDAAHVWGETSKRTGQSFAGTPRLVAEPSIPAGSLRAHRAGSVLGLPAEASHQPLILGKPERSGEEVGIGALTNYGQDIGPKGGRSGSIALLVVLLLLGGALGLYFFVPSVHSRVGAFVAHLRGTDTQAAIEAAMKPKAQVIPSTRPEVNKNMVTARGAVDNISDEPLENLSVEVSLQRSGGAPPEIRTVSVTPNPLPPGVRGVFEFEYDGKRDTGFLGYTITKLYSNGAEVRFRAPGQK